MSGSGDNINVSWTADTSSFDSAMAASASAAKAAFSAVSSAAQSASVATQASVAQMERSLAAAQAQMAALGPAAQGAIGQVVTSLQAQIAAAREAQVASAALAGGMTEVGAAGGVLFQSLQQSIDASMGLDRNMNSAKESSKAFTAAMATQGVSATELSLDELALTAANERLAASYVQLSDPSHVGRLEAQFPGIRQQFSSGAVSAKEFERAIEQTGNRVQTVTGAQFFGMFERQFPGIKTNLSSAAQSAAVFEAALGQTGQAAQRTGQSFTGMLRESMVLGREFTSGNISRAPGSLALLAQYAVGASTALLGIVGAAAVAGFAIYELVKHFHELEEQQRQIKTAGAFFNPQINFDQLDKLTQKLGDLPEVTRKDAAATVAEFARMPGLTAPFLNEIVDNIQVFADALGQKTPEAARTLANAFGEPTTRGRAFMESINATIQQLNAFDTAQDAAGRRAAMLAAYEDKLATAVKQGGEADRQAEAATRNLQETTSSFAGEAMQAAGYTNTFAAAADNIKTERSRAQIDALKAAILSLNNVEKEGGGGGGASWTAKHQLELTDLQTKAAATAKTTKQLDEATAKTAIKVWTDAANEIGITEKQKTEALANANRARLSLMKDEVSGAGAAAKQGLMAQLAAISAQQAAVKNDFTQWKSLQDQKLSIIRGAVGEQTTLYQNALKELNNMERQHADQESEQSIRSIKAQEQIDRDALAAKKDLLQGEVAAHQISKSEELNQLKSLVTQQDEANIESVNNLIKTLQQGTNAYAQAMTLRGEMNAKLVKDVADYNYQITKSDAAAATGAMKAWTTAENKIGDSMEQEVGRFVAGQQTMAQAAQSIVTTIVSATVTGAVKMAASWAASQLAMATASKTTETAVAAAQAAGGTGFGALITSMVAKWTGMETAKTASTVTGSATRTGVEAAETAKDNAGLLTRVAKWIATQLGMTASSTTSAATRAAAETAASTATMAQTKLVSMQEINAAAGVAAANAYAATAAIPYVGPALAPAAAATAFAAVESYQSAVALDVGAYNAPGDMPANVHAGEMVIPATFATGLRAAIGAGGGTASSGSPSASYSPTINMNGGAGNMTSDNLSAALAGSQKQFASWIWNQLRNGNTMLPMRGIAG